MYISDITTQPTFSECSLWQHRCHGNQAKGWKHRHGNRQQDRDTAMATGQRRRHGKQARACRHDDQVIDVPCVSCSRRHVHQTVTAREGGTPNKGIGSAILLLIGWNPLLPQEEAPLPCPCAAGSSHVESLQTR